MLVKPVCADGQGKFLRASWRALQRMRSEEAETLKFFASFYAALGDPSKTCSAAIRFYLGVIGFRKNRMVRLSLGIPSSSSVCEILWRARTV